MTRITVTNGAGETLYEGAPGQITADPPPEQLDGTINITQHWSDGTTRNFTVKHSPNKPVKIGWNKDLGRYEVEQEASALPWDAGGFFGGIAGGLGSHEVGRASVGTVITPDGEKGIAKNDDRVNSVGVVGEIGYNFGKFGRFSSLRASIDFSYFDGDTDSSATEPIGGNAVANTYHVDNPINGSTGVGLGMTGGVAMSMLEFERHDLRLKLEGDYPLSNYVVLTGGVSALYGGAWQTATGSFRSLTFSGISSTNDQELDDHYYGAGLNTRLNFGVSKNINLFAGGGVDFGRRRGPLLRH